MNLSVFRSYDIRGVYPTEINEEFALNLGKSYGTYLQEKYNRKDCIVSFDNRLSSPSLTDALIKGILSTGCNVINLGMTTTPMNYYGRYLNQMPGIMVTASHNPKDENGFKFSFDGMVNARGEMIEDFKEFFISKKYILGIGTETRANIEEKYLDYLKYSLNFGKNKRKVIIDCGNGSTCLIARKIFSKVFCNFEIINEENDGTFPHHHPDPAVRENLRELQEEVLRKKADFGISYDGDGDRIGIVMDNGEVMPIEHYMILMIKDMYESVSNKTFLYDIKCSKCLDDEIKKLGGTGICFRTGASYTEYEVHNKNLPFGGEYSGHMFFRDRDADVGSAIYASLRLLELLSKTSDKLSDLTKDIPKYFATDEVKIPSDDVKKFEVVEKIKDYATRHNYPYNDIDGVRINYTNGWALVRASNTGKNIIFRAEAETVEGKNMLEKIYLSLINEYNK